MKITKTPKRQPEVPRAPAALCARVSDTPDEALADVLEPVTQWPWPRGDLYSWVGVLNRFDTLLAQLCAKYQLGTVQCSPFSPQDKRLLVAVLHFTRLLLENCTNRKLYASYEHLDALLHTSDWDVLAAVLYLLLRPAQQHSGSGNPRHDLPINRARLATLAVVWPPRDAGLELADVAAAEAPPRPPSLCAVHYHYFRRPDKPAAARDDAARGAPSAPSTPNAREAHAPPAQPHGEGLTDVVVPDLHVGDATAQTRVAAVVDAERMRPEDYFELFHKVRVALAYGGDVRERRLSVICRLLAMACYAHSVPESTANSQLFLYEPGVVPRVAALANPQRGMDERVQSAALYALDALGRYRTKLQEVLAALNASVSHGVLLQVVQRMTQRLRAGGAELTPAMDEYVDSIMTVVAYLTTTVSGSNMVIGAGLIPHLVELVRLSSPDVYLVQRTASRVVGLLDSVMYSYPPAFDLFCNAQGIEVVVQRIAEEVDAGVAAEAAATPMEQDEGSAAGANEPAGMPFGRSMLLRNMLKLIVHLMSTPGTSEGLRNLIDTSLVDSLKRIMEHRTAFGPQTLAHAINIMAVFVHNEPTLLATVQEKRLPDAFLASLQGEMEPSFEVITATTTAIGALCLNPAGLELFTSRPVVPQLLSVLDSPRHHKTLLERDNANAFGAAVDELVRHHPSLKDTVMRAILDTLERVLQGGQHHEPPADEEVRAQYQLLRTPREEQGSVPVLPSIRVSDVAKDEPDDYLKPPLAQDHNPVVASIDTMSRFLEGLFRNASHCRDFVRLDGLPRLLGFCALPSIAYSFSASTPADSFVTLMRVMTEISPNTVISALLKEMHTSLLDISLLLLPDLAKESRLAPLLTPNTDEELAKANEAFRKLVTLNARAHVLSDVCQTFSYAGQKLPLNFLQSLNESGTGVVTLQQLGELHRACAWENMLLKAAVAGVAEKAPAEPPAEPPAEGQPAERPPVPHSAAAQSASQAPTPLRRNITSLTYLAAQIPVSLNAFFEETVQLLLPRRNLDPVYRRLAMRTAEDLGAVLKQHLTLRNTPNEGNNLAEATFMLHVVNGLLFDERSPASLHVHTLVVATWDKLGGIDAFTQLLTQFCQRLDAESVQNAARASEGGHLANHLAHAFGGIQAGVAMLHRLVQSRPLLESPHTSHLLSKDSDRSAPPFAPHAFLVQVRRKALALLRRLWEEPWLPTMPAAVARNVIQSLLVILEADSEVPPKRRTAGSSGPLSSSSLSSALASLTGTSLSPLGGMRRGGAPQQETADEERVNQLVEMGFAPNAARIALARCRNNISLATEYVLQHPELADAPEPAPAAPDEPAAPAEEEPPAEEGGDLFDAPSLPRSLRTSAFPPLGDAEEAGGQDTSQESPAQDSSSQAEEEQREAKEALDRERAEFHGRLLGGALHLADAHEAVVFDVKDVVCFLARDADQAAQCISEVLRLVHREAQHLFDETAARAAAGRLRVVMLLLHDAELQKLVPWSTVAELHTLLLHMVQEQQAHGLEPHEAAWLPSALLVLCSVVSLGELPQKTELSSEAGESPMYVAERLATLAAGHDTVFQFALWALQRTEALTHDATLAVYRMLVLLTRHEPQAQAFVQAGGVPALLRAFRTRHIRDMMGCQSSALLVLRHVVENTTTLQRSMEGEIQTWVMQHMRARNSESTSFSKGMAYAVLREPEVFVRAASAKVDILEFQEGKGQAYLRLKGGEQAENAPPMLSAAEDGASEQSDLIVHFLLNELWERTSGRAQAAEPATDGTSTPQRSVPGEQQAHDARRAEPEHTASGEQAVSQEDAESFYVFFLMQCLTELLSSYTACKQSFVHFRGKPTEGKHRTSMLTYFVNELVPAGFLRNYENQELRQRMAESNWAMSVLVALAADVVFAPEVREVPAALVAVRKALLDTVHKAIKDAASSQEELERRYGRLYALADLCFRLLTARPNSTAGARPTEEVALHMAKTMLEKNFVTALTGALADVDLNLPSVKALIEGVLRPLEHLTKVAIKMGKAKQRERRHRSLSHSPHAEPQDSEPSSEGGSSGEESMSESAYSGGGSQDEEEEAPDFYRNSSLGMHTGEMDQGTYNEDELSDEMEEEDDDVEMDEYDNSDDGSELSTEEEGLDGDETHVVEVMDEDEEGHPSHSDDSEEDAEVEEADGDGEPGSMDDEDAFEDVEDEELPSELEDLYDDDEEQGSGDDGEHEFDYVIERSTPEPQNAPMGGILEALDGMGRDQIDDIVLEQEDEDPDDGGESAVDDESVGNGSLSQLEVADPMPPLGGTDDRFGANWGWTHVPRPRVVRPHGLENDGGPPLPPTFFLPTSLGGPGAEGGVPGLGVHQPHHHIASPFDRAPRRDEMDASVHPLLQDSAEQARRGTGAPHGRRDGPPGGFSEMMRSVESLMGGGTMQFLEMVLNRGLQGGGDASIRIELPDHGRGPPRMHISTGEAEHGQRHAPREAPERPEQLDVIAEAQRFVPLPTAARWTEESRLLCGALAADRSQLVRNHMINRLLPGYHARKRAEAEAKARIDAEREAQEKELRETRRLRDEAVQQLNESKSKLHELETEVQRIRRGEPRERAGEDVEMREAAPQEAEPPAADGAAPRVTVSVHGQTVDLTNTGIDPTFLEALPDELREEALLSQHLGDRLEQASAPLGIANDFFDVLPPEMRAELAQREAGHGEPPRPPRAEPEREPPRREREPSSGGVALTRDNPASMRLDLGEEPPRESPRRGAARDAIQLLDRAGIATLVRLLFFPQMNAKQSALHKVLGHLSKNARSRVELLNLLLLVLAEGTTSTTAVDRSFAHMSTKVARAFGTPSRGTPRRSQPATPVERSTERQERAAGSSALMAPLTRIGEEAPYLIASRSIETLVYLAQTNEQAALYFLREDVRPSKRAKGKDRADGGNASAVSERGSAPVNVLLGLLEKDAILSSPQLVDAVILLLNTVTKPLTSLPKQPAPDAARQEGHAAEEQHPAERAPAERAPAEREPAAPAPEGEAEAPAADAAQDTQPFTLTQAPYIPPERLAAVVRPLSLSISSRGFQHTLAVASHLAVLDNMHARDVISGALRHEAQKASVMLMGDLDALIASLPPPAQSPEAATQAPMPGAGRVQSGALSKLASPESAQAVFLRSLRALDYLYVGR